jgi:xanthine dehydrogenase small subunit
MRTRPIFYLNGERHEPAPEHSGWILADYLRQQRLLTGTKIVCAEGDCGACTVLRYYPRPGRRGMPRYLAVNSCILTVAQLDGSSLVTVDALAEAREHDKELHPVQKAMMSCHGSQCGFCTPGFVMALSGLVEKKLCEKALAPITPQEAKNATTGNLCRCTGYQPIIDAAVSIPVKKVRSVAERFYCRAQALDLAQIARKPLRIEAPGFRFFAPRTLREAALFLKKNPDARILGGATDLGVVHNKRKLRLTDILSLHLVDELYGIELKKDKLLVGSRVTLSELRAATREKIPELARFLDLFASPQIKNVATLAGNLANASPIGDTLPYLLVSGARVHLTGPRGKRAVAIEDFFKGYRKTALKPGELIARIELEVPDRAEALRLYKISQRRDLDISTVSGAFRLKWKDRKRAEIASVRIGLGGVAATPLRLPKTEAFLKGCNPAAPDWRERLTRAVDILHSEMTPMSDLRGSAAFRRVAAENLFRKFFEGELR